MDLVGPVGQAQRAQVGVGAGQREVAETPPPPCTWIARSSTFSATFGAATLIAAISVRAWRLPTVSISHAAFSVSRRAISISIRDSAIQSWMLAARRQRLAERHPRDRPFAHRLERPLGRSDRAHAVVDAPGAEASLGDHEAVALAGDQVRGRHADVVEVDFGVALLVVVAEHD